MAVRSHLIDNDVSESEAPVYLFSQAPGIETLGAKMEFAQHTGITLQRSPKADVNKVNGKIHPS